MKRFAAVVLAMWTAGSALAEEAVPPGGHDAATAEPGATDYCANFADKAAEARIAWQTANLKKLQDDVSRKIAELEARQKEMQSWIDKRNAMLKEAGKELVDIYAKMDPEAAALQLAKLDTTTAVAVLRQLSPRAASTILASIEPVRAATLAKAIASATMEPAVPAGSAATGKGS
jgi:flagellar motility protein MotE (MotC chaperone)